ncbi:GNAT family N-acetyltransferase [Geodermatophilus maliterrae]|uniref:GNAT family N-acetyltransferase n=1 Tax=Geodermatophilus maliterrae TaxID=3162531 RepID=A0ABV3XJU1_9ACTN
MGQVGPLAAGLAGDRATAADGAEAALAERRLDEPHVTLAGLGVARRQQGRGLGAATLAPGLARADRDGLPVHLETSAGSNVRFYRRLGFTVTDVVDPAGRWSAHLADAPRAPHGGRRPGGRAARGSADGTSTRASRPLTVGTRERGRHCDHRTVSGRGRR